MARTLLDTNLLVYAYGADQRAEVARALVADGFVLAVQSMNEFTRVARVKLKFEWDEVRAALQAFELAAVHVQPLDLGVHHEGIRIAERYKLQVFDSMLVGAALVAGCDTLLSEDMQRGLVIDDRLVITNPFAA